MLHEKSRLAFLDNLKVILIMLVIAHHSALAYAPAGTMWLVPNVSHSKYLSYFLAFNNSFLMSLFFLVSGYFVPASLDRKGSVKYLIGRLIRLGIPIVFFC